MTGSVWDMLNFSFPHISVRSQEDNGEVILWLGIRELGLSGSVWESSAGRCG